MKSTKYCITFSFQEVPECWDELSKIALQWTVLYTLGSLLHQNWWSNFFLWPQPICGVLLEVDDDVRGGSEIWLRKWAYNYSQIQMDQEESLQQYFTKSSGDNKARRVGGALKYNVVSRCDERFFKFTLNKYFLLEPKYTLNADFTHFLPNFTSLNELCNQIKPKGFWKRYPSCWKLPILYP